jgi:hypothetical protein
MEKKALTRLREEKMIRRIGLEKPGDKEVYYELSPEYTDLYRGLLIKAIADILRKVRFQVKDRFFNEVKKQPLSSVNTFWLQLSFLIVQSEHEAESCHLWETFFSNLPKSSFPYPVADFISNLSEADRLEQLETIVKSSGISPAVLCLVKYFQNSPK